MEKPPLVSATLESGMNTEAVLTDVSALIRSLWEVGHSRRQLENLATAVEAKRHPVCLQLKRRSRITSSVEMVDPFFILAA